MKDTMATHAAQVSNFDQTASVRESSLASGCVGAHGGCVMPKTNEFWQYAKEAILSASYAENDKERQWLLDLARTWTQAALIERRAQVDSVAENPVALPPARQHRSAQIHASI